MERHHAYCRPTQVKSWMTFIAIQPRSNPESHLSRLQSIKHRKLPGKPKTYFLRQYDSLVQGLLRNFQKFPHPYSIMWRETREAWARDLLFTFFPRSSLPFSSAFPGTFQHPTVLYFVTLCLHVNFAQTRAIQTLTPLVIGQNTIDVDSSSTLRYQHLQVRD